MSYKLVIIGAVGHSGLVTHELDRYPQVRWCAYAPSFEGEDVSSYTAGGAQAYSDWRTMLDAEAPDIVTICGRYDLNAPLAIEAAHRGCQVISEKPAASNLAELARLRHALAHSGVHYASMLAMRYDAPYYTAHSLVQQGLIGEPYLITAQKSYRWGNNRPTWYADGDRYGSSMTWVGIHAFDYARWVTGVDYIEVSAHHANLVHKERPACQDVATVLARLANGGSATFSLDFLRPEAARTHGDDRLRVAGSQGVLEICDSGTRLHVFTAAQDIPAWPLTAPGRTLLGDLLAAMEGRGSLLAPMDEALSITTFAIQAARAADMGRSVIL